MNRNKTYVVWSCAHAHPDVPNDRFDWLGSFLYDIKPDLAIDLGDAADMTSLNSFDKGKPKALVHQNYGKDIDCYHDSMKRIRKKFKENRRKKPTFIGFEGNHETRIKTALSKDPRLEAGDTNYGISFKHLKTNKWFDEYHEYVNSGPAIGTYGGVDFAHFFQAGGSDKGISGMYHGSRLLTKRHRSAICGHTHKRNIHFDDCTGHTGAVVGCFKGGPESWAGQSNEDWWKGVLVMREVDGSGRFDPQFVSMDALRKEYGENK